MSKPYPTLDELGEEFVLRFHRSYSLSDGCWNWNLAKDGHGYGAVSFKGRVLASHRVAYVVANGSIPDGLCVCHRCDNPACVRPDHLFLGTHKQNMDDRTAKGRTGPRQGIRNGNAKLNEELVRRARALHGSGMSFAAIAREFGELKVSWKAIAHAVKGERWSHVT